MTITQVPGYDVERGRRAVHTALDVGVRLFDTADVYGAARGGDGVNELALADALRRWPGPLDDVVVATKGGPAVRRDRHLVDGRSPRASAQGLHRVDPTTRTRPAPPLPHHRPDPQIPYECRCSRSVTSTTRVWWRGSVSPTPTSAGSISRSRSWVTLWLAVQNEYSPSARSAEVEIRACEDRGLAFLSGAPSGV
ncbi:hypothetical protein GS444_15010 [Rhodococcus hoagii]|nr:hypothetical protein [Prescottella equi]